MEDDVSQGSVEEVKLPSWVQQLTAKELKKILNYLSLQYETPWNKQKCLSVLQDVAIEDIGRAAKVILLN